MKKIYKKILIITVSFIFCLQHLSCYGKGLCVGNESTIECLKHNFIELYSSNYSLFWNILKAEEKKAISCKSIPDTSKFFELASIKSTNAEFNEYIAEFLENLVIKKSECFLDSLLNLNEKSISDVINILQHPTFIEEKEIAKVFFSNKQNKKYDKVMKIYFKE